MLNGYSNKTKAFLRTKLEQMKTRIELMTSTSYITEFHSLAESMIMILVDSVRVSLKKVCKSGRY